MSEEIGSLRLRTRCFNKLRYIYLFYFLTDPVWLLATGRPHRTSLIYCSSFSFSLTLSLLSNTSWKKGSRLSYPVLSKISLFTTGRNKYLYIRLYNDLASCCNTQTAMSSLHLSFIYFNFKISCTQIRVIHSAKKLDIATIFGTYVVKFGNLSSNKAENCCAWKKVIKTMFFYV